MIDMDIGDDKKAIIGIEEKDVFNCKKYIRILKNGICVGEYPADLIKKLGYLHINFNPIIYDLDNDEIRIEEI